MADSLSTLAVQPTVPKPETPPVTPYPGGPEKPYQPPVTPTPTNPVQPYPGGPETPYLPPVQPGPGGGGGGGGGGSTAPKSRAIPNGGAYTPPEYQNGYRLPNQRNWNEQPVNTDGGAGTGGRAPGLYAANGAAQVTVDSVDPSRFMNPYIEQAMEPALRAIEQRFGKTRSQIGATAATSGAFGDDRHRMLDEAAYRDERSAISDTISQMMKAGYDTSLAASERDVDRLLGASQFNAGMQDKSIDRQVGVQESAANRDLTWNQFLNQLDQTEQDRALRAAELGNALDQSQYQQQMQYSQEAADLDNYIRGWNQQDLNAQYEEFMMRYMWPMTQLGAVKGGMSAPYGQQQNNQWASIIGGLLGGLM